MTLTKNLFITSTHRCLALVLMLCSLNIHARQITGEVVGGAEPTFYVEYATSSGPKVGQMLTVIWEADGSGVEVGKLEVEESEQGFVTATLVEGQADIGMKAVFQSSSNGSAGTSTSNSAPESAYEPPTSDDFDEAVGEYDTQWANSLVNAESWGDQTILDKSNALSRYSRAVASSTSKKEIHKKRALRLFLKSAEQGYKPSQFRAGWMFENGLGTDQNLSLALAWYTLAAAEGHDKAALGVRRLAELVEKPAQ